MGHPFLGIGLDTWAQKFEREEKADFIYRITSTGAEFNLRSMGTVNYTVSWGDGDSESSTSNTLSHTYSAGNYKIKVILTPDTVYRPFFNDVDADIDQLTSVRIRAKSSELGSNLSNAFDGASNLSTYSQRFNATKNVINFDNTWKSTAALTTFPRINVSSGTIFDDTWRNSGVVNFPVLDMSSGTSFSGTWRSCDGLVSFPGATMTSGTDFQNCWRSCDNLTTFPADQFDTTGTLGSNAFKNAFKDCALSAQSIENILVSLEYNSDVEGNTGVSLGLDGGTNAAKSTWSATANSAYNALVSRGWTISYNT